MNDRFAAARDVQASGTGRAPRGALHPQTQACARSRKGLWVERTGCRTYPFGRRDWRRSGVGWMNSRRGSTSSPINLMKIVPLLAMLDLHLQQVRASGSSVVSRAVRDSSRQDLCNAAGPSLSRPPASLRRTARSARGSAARRGTRAAGAPLILQRGRQRLASRRTSAERGPRHRDTRSSTPRGLHVRPEAAILGRAPCQPRSYSAAIGPAVGDMGRALRGRRRPRRAERPRDRRLLDDDPRICECRPAAITARSTARLVDHAGRSGPREPIRWRRAAEPRRRSPASTR